MSDSMILIEDRKTPGSISMKLSAWEKIRKFAEDNGFNSPSAAAEHMILTYPEKNKKSNVKAAS